MSTGLPNPSRPSTGYEHAERTRKLVKAVIEAFRYHPFFFMLRSSLTSEDSVYPFAHQLELLGKAFARRPVRVLIGDEIGLGKTVSAIMLMKYLLEAERVERVLVLVPRVLLRQWLSELKRFNLTNVVRLERESLSTYRGQGFPRGVYVASIDLLKREEHREKVLGAKWDLVVVDEAHRVGRIGGRETQRFELVSRLVGDPGVNVILLTATPHRGKPEDYIERLKLVDPFIRASPRELDDERFYRLCMSSIVFRRTKPDVNGTYERAKIFTDCRFKARVVKASDEEESFHRRLIEFLRSTLLRYYGIAGEEPKALPLLMTLIAKRASSSPRAALVTLDRILRRRAERLRSLGAVDTGAVEGRLNEDAGLIADALLGYSFDDVGLYEDERGEAGDPDDIVDRFAEECSVLLGERDIERLRDLHESAKSIMGGRDSRLKSLTNVVLEHLGRGEKVVVFTEFRDTAEYIFSELRRSLPRDFAERTAMVTSKGVVPPAARARHGGRYDIEDVKRWLRDGDVVLLVSTDVASEGLNLQVANVVIHYEPTWSPVKIVQRIGRVWRLGQERDVYSYCLLLTVESDMAALEILYAKLLSWILSGVERQVPIGEELEIDMLPRDKAAYDMLQVPLAAERGRPQYSEFRAWIEFIAGGRERLKRYVEGIISALARLRELAERFGLARVEAVKVERFLSEGLGDLYGRRADQALKDLLATIARLRGYDIEERESGLFVIGTHMTGLKTSLDLYRAIETLLRDVGAGEPVTLIVRRPTRRDLPDVEEVRLYEALVRVGGRPTHSEAVGVVVRGDGSTEVLRGLTLLRVLGELLRGVIGIGDRLWSSEDPSSKVKSYVLDSYCTRMLDEYSRYIDGVERGFSSAHEGWLPRRCASQSLEVSARPLGVIVTAGRAGRAPPPAAVEEVERRAMEFAMRYERENGRDPEDVSKFEHYDIRSVDPRTGEVRFIEVKGRWHFDVTVELTEAEYEYAKSLGDRYWLYVVYGFSAGSPRLLAIKDPVNRAKWATFEERRYRLLGA